jgi:hypothetical protein
LDRSGLRLEAQKVADHSHQLAEVARATTIVIPMMFASKGYALCGILDKLAGQRIRMMKPDSPKDGVEPNA